MAKYKVGDFIVEKNGVEKKIEEVSKDENGWYYLITWEDPETSHMVTDQVYFKDM